MEVEPRIEPARRSRKLPLFNVVLLDDDDHTYDYVIGMLRKLFGMASEQAFTLAAEVDTSGRVIIDTTTLERAEFKRDQIHGFGRDWRVARCCGSMTAVVEPVRS
jgi:ATP-dependent Clp protease adaptor protein ClpS